MTWSNELLSERFDRIDDRFDRVDERFEDVDRRFEDVDRRFGQVDRRFGQVVRRFEQVDRRFEQVDRHFGQVDRRFVEVNRKIDLGFAAAREESVEVRNAARADHREVMQEVGELRRDLSDLQKATMRTSLAIVVSLIGVIGAILAQAVLGA